VPQTREAIKRNLGAWGVAFASVLILLAIEQFSLWHLFGVPHLEPLFIDWYALLAASDCKALGIDPFQENPCDIVGRKHIYGSIWLYLSNLGLSRADLFWSGICFFVMPYILTASLTLNPRTLKQFILALALILSPASLLGIERANADVAIYSLLFVGTTLLLANDLGWKVAGLGHILITGVMKLYPFVALAAIMTVKNRWHLATLLSIAAAAVALYIWTAWDEIILLRNIVVRPKYGPVFGAELVFHRLNRISIEPLITSPKTATIIAAAVTTIVATGFRHMAINKWPGAPTPETVFMLVGSSILAATFFLNTNFDYRCVFIIFTIPYLCLCRNWAAKLAIALSVYVMWAYMIHAALYRLVPGKAVILSELIEFVSTYLLIGLLMSATIRLVLSAWNETKRDLFCPIAYSGAN
jgi:uncharacterized membrane protein